MNNSEWEQDSILLTPDGTLLHKLKNGSFVSVNPEIHIVEFSTGLRDYKRTEEYPEGQEIYAGDIFEDKNYRNGKVESIYWQVIWNEKEYAFQLMANIQKQYRGEKYREDVYHNLRKIVGDKMVYAGNIHEHPHLLEGGE